MFYIFYSFKVKCHILEGHKDHILEGGKSHMPSRKDTYIYNTMNKCFSQGIYTGICLHS